jgi:predicted unusual protein kinase regulating ubiquinone biosynthesis (AarF/ABC1/UbiB family)
MYTQHKTRTADLHPGNILIHVEGGKPTLTLVDAGMVRTLWRVLLIVI